MALTNLQAVRLAIQDNTPGLYIISDDEINYILEKNNNNVNTSSLEAARIVLFQLSMSGDSVVDILSIRGSKAAEQYRLALELYLKNPYLNPVLANAGAWAGGISLAEMQTNNTTIDNNYVTTPNDKLVTYNDNPFLI